MNNKSECCCFICWGGEGNIVSNRKAPFLREDLKVFMVKCFHKLHLFTLILFLVKIDNAETRSGEESEAYRVGKC